VAFVLNGVQAADCDVATLWAERVFVVLPEDHVLRSNQAIDWHDIGSERFIVRGSECDSALCYRISQSLSDHNHSVRIRKFDVGRGTLMQLVAMGWGVGLTSEATAGISFPGIIFRPIADTDGTVSFCAVWSPHNYNPALRRFLSLARVLARQRKKAGSTVLYEAS
jgi:DNA-binding transcriptional LysR family regulator